MPVIQVYVKDALYKDIIILDSKVRSKIIITALTEVAAGVSKPKGWGLKRNQTEEAWQVLRQQKLNEYLQKHSLPDKSSADSKKLIAEAKKEIAEKIAAAIKNAI